MGIFDKVGLDDFLAFKEEVERTLKQLESEIRAKVTDSEDTARIAAASAVAIEQKIRASETKVEQILQELEGFKGAALSELTALKNEKEKVAGQNAELSASLKQVAAQYTSVLESQQKIGAAEADIAAKVVSITKHLEASQSLPGEVKETQELLNESKKLNESVANVLSHSLKKKSEIDEIHKKILGEDIKDEEGKVQHVDGLKDELERSYSAISGRIDAIRATADTAIGEITADHETALREQKNDFEKLLTESAARYDSVNSQLTGLLPGAMAEGLSAAYESKKDDEIKSLSRFEKNFSNAIGGLVLISLIPFCVDIFLLAVQGKELVQVIKDTPSLIAAILPLYFPVLWLAYASNKRVNLSKRLIEEYTHKAVLGKTFSGLSNQIETLQHQSKVKEELRTRLLSNVLQVSAENPGKLITNYNKADHPLMEALETSAKLAESVKALSKIPGFAAVAKKLSEKSDALFKEQSQKVEDGVDIQSSLQHSDDEEAEPAKA